MAIVRSCPALPQREMSLNEFKTWIMRFDADHDRTITKDELKHALHSIRSWFTWWKAREGMKEADVDGDGHIDEKEIEKLAAYAQHHLNMKISSSY